MYMQRRYKTCHAVGDVSGHFALQGQLTDVDAACPVGQGERRRAVTRRAWRHLTNAHVHVHKRAQDGNGQREELPLSASLSLGVEKGLLSAERNLTPSARPKGVCLMLIGHSPATQIVQYGDAAVREIPSDAHRRMRRHGGHSVPHDTLQPVESTGGAI
ncbi:uncharacterized protein TRIVIDRAFT_61969 [Trichoderma virens Gv29-8]|uniref:Uncharacterized protein n=1 Tax=Hypocrea virens (strain Gv29-8 / FGSC 10586) TaxID=413071 RepID=G9MIF8_HYPVG|nr:uncharacterized protein TRIVIDRAFT_61969 [Trichoderma virens Gv29-8]EHK25275.1 hypothetical protein TRIVIDRAFT_61969 [Trichoderma virens Gv29-8]UKZ48900.1 hypothetical protein TrVGV298_003136 [Trichoderma virens]